jgi:epoxyqueuosine reductase
MVSIETRMKSLGMSLGANLVGITTTEALADGPPSADPRYLLPSANSVISFALSLDRNIVQDFISKKSWRPHCENRKAIAQTLYTIGDTAYRTTTIGRIRSRQRRPQQQLST